jgi:hypothetical protein
MSWDEMPGDDRVRHCERCRQNVYDVSELTTAEAEALIDASPGALCDRRASCRHEGRAARRTARTRRRPTRALM